MESLLCSLLLFSLLLCGSLGAKEATLSRTKRKVGSKPYNVVGSCGGIKSGNQGYIASPNFPHSAYTTEMSCDYKIIVSKGKIIKFEFVYMDLENGPKQLGGTCAADWIAIYDGRDDTYPLVGEQKYCGYTIEFNPVFSTTHFVLVRFRSDSYLQRSGFAIRYTKVDPLKDESFNCNFDERHDMCYGWIQSEEDDFDWQFTTGHTPSGKTNVTGPWQDHTLKNSEGTFAYIEASRKRVNATAILMTPPKDISKANNYCFRFWYHMRGSGIGALMVYKLAEDEEITGHSQVVFQRRKQQGSEWKEARITVPKSQERIRFAFAGIRGASLFGDIAIDDVKIARGRCPVIKTTTAPATTTTRPTTTVSTTARTRTTRSTTPATSILFQTPPPLLTTVPGGCPEGHHQCKEVGNCVPPMYICDLERDCLHFDDEDNCDAEEESSNQPCSWANWSEWSACSRTCGGGSRRKERATVNGKLGDFGCIGISLMTENCNTCRCSNWNTWSTWVECSVSCGPGGLQSRTRSCNVGTCNRNRCPGARVQLINCNGHNCPEWGGFSTWTPCPVTCGDGLVSRSRKCIGGEVGQDGCIGNKTETQTCRERDTDFPVCPATSLECPPRNSRMIRLQRRRCPTSCNTDADCAGGQRCNCDGACGQTCSDPNISCPSLSAPTGGTMTCSNGESVGSKCTIACSDGYVMDGTKEMNCRSNRRWDKSSVPECRKIKIPPCPRRNLRAARARRKVCSASCQTDADCSEGKRCFCDGICGLSCMLSRGNCGDRFLKVRQRGRSITCTNGAQVGSICTVSCSSGYKLVGAARRMCRGNQQWDKAIPTCRRLIPSSRSLPCGPAPPRHNSCCGTRSYNSRFFICCNNNVVRKVVANGCCGTTPFHIRTQGCCVDRLYYKPRQQCCGTTIISSRRRQGCCNNEIFDTRTHSCEQSNLLEIDRSAAAETEEEEEEE